MRFSKSERAIAEAMGETPREVRRRGFQVVESPNQFLKESEPLSPQIVDWDGAPDVSDAAR